MGGECFPLILLRHSLSAARFAPPAMASRGIYVAVDIVHNCKFPTYLGLKHSSYFCRYQIIQVKGDMKNPAHECRTKQDDDLEAMCV